MATGKLRIGTQRRLGLKPAALTSKAYIQPTPWIPCLCSSPSSAAVNSNSPRWHFGEARKQEGEGRRDVAIPNNAETLCSLQLNNLLWQLPLPAGVSSQILSTHVQCAHYTHLYLYRRQLLPIIATCETRGGALKIKELQSKLEANLGFYRQGSVWQVVSAKEVALETHFSWFYFLINFYSQYYHVLPTHTHFLSSFFFSLECWLTHQTLTTVQL